MADKTYTVNQESPESITGFETFNSQDVSLINSFEVNTLFNPDKNFMELHVVSLIDEVLESDYNYTSYKQLGNAQSAGNSGASVLTLDPVADVKRYGYENGSVKLLYHFLNDLFSETKTPVEFFIENISEDRTELRLQTFQLTAEKIVERVNEVKAKLYDQSFFSEFRLDFKNNDLFIGVNIDTVDLGFDKVVVVKLYEPLPVTYVEKSTLNIVEIIADSVAYEIDYEVTEDEPVEFSLKPTNFNLDISDDSTIPTGYYNYDELFSYPVNNSNSQIYSMISQKGIELSINHTDYSNFIHFSSAQERLLNFKYKVDLISSSYASIELLNTATRGMTGISGSQTYHNGIIEGIINNFDHYERFLYYESGSSSWPKLNSVKPYINQSSLTLESINWFTNQLANAVGYDLSNTNSILSAIPSYIKDDTDNESYLTFMFMIGQHFDLLWIYAKAVSDKYDADNRLDHGIPKDLVGEALKNFGVKLYTSNKSIEDLFTTITGQPYQSGSEIITQYITGSLTGSNTPVQPVSYDGYTKEVQKRLYHNLPLLLKSKGTERGLRALINCFGIPSDTLQIKLYGGQNTTVLPFFGDLEYYTSSLDKVRIDNTGSLISGNTLSKYVSTVKQDTKYTDDIHVVEVGFSPTDSVNSYIISKSLNTFNIDDYIGDPRNLHSTEYTMLGTLGSSIQTLSQLTEQIMSGSSNYDVYEYVRLIKFFDNTIFKMVKDFVPARSVADTGIVIKPHILHRSKAKSVVATGTDQENLFTASIDTVFIESTHGRTFGSRDQYNTRYVETIQTPFGLGTSSYHNQQEAKYDGELSGSQLTVTDGHLTEGNIYTVPSFVESTDNLLYISASIATCTLGNINNNTLVYDYGTTAYQVNTFFTNTQAVGMIYTLNPGNIEINFPYVFSESQFNQYDVLTITAVDTNITPCTTQVTLMYGKCDIRENLTSWDNTAAYPTLIKVEEATAPVNLLDPTYFIIGTNHNLNTLTVVIKKNDITIDTLTGVQAQSFSWNNPLYQFDNNDTVTITVVDTSLTPYQGGIECTATATVTVADCTIAPLLNMSIGTNDTNANQDTIQVGTTGRYERNANYLGGTIILGARNAEPTVGDFDLPNPGLSPIHHTQYTYPDGQTYDMTIKFPYLTNPNYIFEGFDSNGFQNGSIRQSLPVLSTEPGEPSDLSGYQLGLASFFTDLGNLNEIAYEVYIYDVRNPGNRPYGDPNVNNLVFAATDWNNDNFSPSLGGSENLGGPGATTGAIKPGQTSTTDTNFPFGSVTIDGEAVPYWTYTTPAPNKITGDQVNGYVAELNIAALVEGLGFGKKIWRPLLPSDQQGFENGYAYYVKIYAYSPSPNEESDGEGYICFSSVGITVEAWIRIVSSGSTTGGIG
jgi:hypothetical protein